MRSNTVGPVDQMVEASTATTSSPVDDHEARRGRVAGMVVLLALAAVVALSWAIQPPTPVPASAPTTAFSAERAYADLQRIAGPEPTPIGSVGSDAIRDDDAVFFTVFGQMITYPMWLVWPLAGLALGIVIALGVLACRRAATTTPQLLVGAAAALLPMAVALLAAIGLWQLLIMIRPGYGDLVMGDPYRLSCTVGRSAVSPSRSWVWYLALRPELGWGPWQSGP
jgi:hypothetical protein